MPTVSVVMPVFNGAAYLVPAIESIRDQTIANFEFVIVDDGSTDETPAILREQAARDPRIRIVTQSNGGVTRALRRGVAEATGTYVARMDADDLSVPERLERQVALLRSDRSLVAASCYIEHFRLDGSVAHIERMEDDHRLIPLYCCFFNRVGGGGQVLFDRLAYETAGGFDAEFPVSEDYDLWTRLLDHGGIGVVDEVLYRYRTGHDSISRQKKALQIALSARIIRREHEKLTGHPLTRDTAQALIDFWWARKPENTPVRDTIAASRAMDRAIDSFFAKNPELAALEPEVRHSIARSWRWRIPLADRGNLPRRALLASHALYWAASARAARSA